MTQNLDRETGVSGNDMQANCMIWMGILQIAMGALLVVGSVFVYSLMHHVAVTIPAIMGAALIVQGAKAFMVCRHRPLFSDHHHPSSGMMG